MNLIEHKCYLRETSFCEQKFLAGKRLSQASGFDETDLTRSEAGLLYQNDGGGQGGDGDGVDEGVGGGVAGISWSLSRAPTRLVRPCASILRAATVTLTWITSFRTPNNLMPQALKV